MDPQILCISSLGMFIPIMYYIFYLEYSHTYTLLATLILSNIMVSILFWKDAGQHGFFHKIDGILAKITFLCSLGYILLFKTMSPIEWFLFGMILGKIGFYIYLSNEYSSKEWCCPVHIYYHLFFHLSIPTGLMFCFM